MEGIWISNGIWECYLHYTRTINDTDVNMASKNKREGVCKLTANVGRFVDSHLIPKALTKPERAGAPLIQGGRGQYPRKRWSSWYDPALVTQEGEDILARHDTWAISEFRKKKLLWSGWGPALRLIENHSEMPSTGWGFRKIFGLDPVKARLFIASILWRAAASSLPEFSEIEIPDEDLERLRIMIVTNDPGPMEFYPASLIQLSTIGEIHNQSPIAQIKTNPAFEGMPEKKIPIFRFYFDGLIIHIMRQSKDDYGAKDLGSIIVGNGDELMVTTVRYETSFQRENLELIKNESFQAAIEKFTETRSLSYLKNVL